MDGAAGSGSSEAGEDTRDLHARQWLFARCLAKLILYAESRGYILTLAEVGVQPHRKSRLPDGIAYETYLDGVHMPSSLHYIRLAADVNLFIGGDLIRDSHHFGYVDLGSFWEALDPLCAWGGRFRSPDGNHFSVRYGGRA